MLAARISLLLLGVGTIIALMPHATAQSLSHGYVLAAPGTSNNDEFGTVLKVGVGGEYVFDNGVGVGGEVAGMGLEDFHFGFGLASVNGSYHIPREDSKIDPFITGGYTVAFPGSANLFNVGGGVNWWVRSRLGVRLEVRDHVYTGSSAALHVVTFGVGLTFR